MSHRHHHQKRRRSRSPANKREDNNRRRDSYNHRQSTQSNRQYDYHYQADRPVSVNEIISRSEEYSPIVQSLVRELLLEQGKHKLTEERLNRSERENAALRVQCEQAMNSLALLKRDFDQYRLDFKPNSFELNELRHSNGQYRPHIDPLLNNEREMYINDDMFYPKRQRRR